jgi:hypothetical protein
MEFIFKLKFIATIETTPKNPIDQRAMAGTDLKSKSLMEPITQSPIHVRKK